jgi:hypothetical protein
MCLPLGQLVNASANVFGLLVEQFLLLCQVGFLQPQRFFMLCVRSVSWVQAKASVEMGTYRLKLFDRLDVPRDQLSLLGPKLSDHVVELRFPLLGFQGDLLDGQLRIFLHAEHQGLTQMANV